MYVHDCSQDHNTDTDRALANVTHCLAAEFECGAVAVISADFLLFCTLLDAGRVPHRDCNKSCKPQYYFRQPRPVRTSCGRLLVYNMSTARKAYAFANFFVRLHIGTMTR